MEQSEEAGMKTWERLDGPGRIRNPLFIIRWNEYEYGTSVPIYRPYDLLDMLTRKLGIPESQREAWLYEHGDDMWELEVGPGGARNIGAVQACRIHASTDHGRRRDITERIKAAYEKALRDAIPKRGGPQKGRGLPH